MMDKDVIPTLSPSAAKGKRIDRCGWGAIGVPPTHTGSSLRSE